MNESLKYRAVVLDLDGVLTDTREFHFKSWKKVFDKLLIDKGMQEEFSRSDYEKHVDGETRRDGIKNFLLSKSIPLNLNEVEELAMNKNKIYLELIHDESLHLFPDAKTSLKRWHETSIPIAIVSSSENCRFILRKLEITQTIQVVVDGTDGKKLKLEGKPAPDFFQEALHRLNAKGSDSIAVEDSLSGVEACKKAGLGKVYGISRRGQSSSEELYRAGADIVISTLEEIE